LVITFLTLQAEKAAFAAANAAAKEQLQKIDQLLEDSKGIKPPQHFRPRHGAKLFLSHWLRCERCHDMYEDPLRSLEGPDTTPEEREENERIYWKELDILLE